MTDFELRQEGRQLKFKNLQFGVGLPIEWAFADGDGLGGPPVTDAGTIHFTVADADDELYEDGITVSISLQKIIEQVTDGAKNGDGLIREPHIRDLKKLVDELRAQANAIESLFSVSAKETPTENP